MLFLILKKNDSPSTFLQNKMPEKQRVITQHQQHIIMFRVTIMTSPAVMSNVWFFTVGPLTATLIVG